IRRNIADGKAYAVTTPLLTKSDGSKFGKSEGGNIWLDPNLTSPYQFYQFWINADDKDIPRFLRFFSLRPHQEIEELESLINTSPREVKRTLAEELTTRIHSREDCHNAVQVSEILFNPQAGADRLHGMSENALKMIATEIPAFQIPRTLLSDGASILDMLAGHTTICASKGEARRAIQSNAVSVNKEKVREIDVTLTTDQLLHGRYLLLENGKKHKFILEFTP